MISQKPSLLIAENRALETKQLSIMIQGLMGGFDERSAYEIMVDLCYQEHPPGIAKDVSISVVKKSR